MKGLVTVSVVGSLLLLSGCGSQASQAANSAANTTTNNTVAPTNQASTPVTAAESNQTSANQAAAPANNSNTTTDNVPSSNTTSQSALPSNIPSNDPIASTYFQVTPQAIGFAENLSGVRSNGKNLLSALEISTFKADQEADQPISLSSYNGPQASQIVLGTTPGGFAINIYCNTFTDPSQIQPFSTWMTNFSLDVEKWMFHNQSMQAVEGFTLPVSTPQTSTTASTVPVNVWLDNADGTYVLINYADPMNFNAKPTSGPPYPIAAVVGGNNPFTGQRLGYVIRPSSVSGVGNDIAKALSGGSAQ